MCCAVLCCAVQASAAAESYSAAFASLQQCAASGPPQASAPGAPPVPSGPPAATGPGQWFLAHCLHFTLHGCGCGDPAAQRVPSA